MFGDHLRLPLVRAALTAGGLLAAIVAAEARCDIDPAPCRGCGCKGGPGWREIATGRCVGFRDIDQKCGRPPSSTLCVFENAPGTGANRDCALAPALPKWPQPSRP